MQNINFDDIIHQPTRTKIMVYLMTSGETSYTELKKLLKLSDGQMTSHMRALIENDYVSNSKFFEANRPKTTYAVTKEGQNKFSDYLDSLKTLINRL